MTKRGRGQRRSRRLKNRAKPIQWLRFDFETVNQASQAFQIFARHAELFAEAIRSFAIPKHLMPRSP